MTRRFVLDTSVAVDLLAGDAGVTDAVRGLEGLVFISILTQVELEGGVYRRPEELLKRRRKLDLFLEGVIVVAFGRSSALRYGQILAATGYSRRKLLDRMIAAQALVHRAALVTRNPADFRDVSALELMAV